MNENSGNRVPAAVTNDYSYLAFAILMAAMARSTRLALVLARFTWPPKWLRKRWHDAAPPYSFEITSFSDIAATVAASMIAATADRPTM